MTHTAMIVGFDQHAAFEVLDAELVEITSHDLLEHVAGSDVNGACVNTNNNCGANGSCFNSVNTVCPSSQLNGVCVQPNQSC